VEIEVDIDGHRAAGDAQDQNLVCKCEVWHDRAFLTLLLLLVGADCSHTNHLNTIRRTMTARAKRNAYASLWISSQ
jgi:hypothetical protein